MTGRDDTARKTILVVDDDLDILDLMTFALEGEGYVVTTASSGYEALELLRGGAQCSLILLDLMMPGMNGWRFLEELAKLEGFQGPPICILSAATDAKIPPGVECFLRKPIDLSQLTAAIERHIARSNGGP